MLSPDERMSCRRALALPLFSDSAQPFALSKQSQSSEAGQHLNMEARPVVRSHSMPAGKAGMNAGIGSQNRQALQQAISQQNVIVQGRG